MIKWWWRKLAQIKVYPKEVLLNIVNRAEKKSIILNGVRLIKYSKLKKVIASSINRENNIIRIKKIERRNVINQLEKNKFIKIVNRTKIQFLGKELF